MSTYEHDLLTARFAALAPSALPGDSGRARQGRRGPSRVAAASRGHFGAEAVAAGWSSHWRFRCSPLPSQPQPTQRCASSSSTGASSAFLPWKRRRALRERRARPELHRNEHYPRTPDDKRLRVRRRASDLGAARRSACGREQVYEWFPRATPHPRGRRALAVEGHLDRTVPPRRRSDHRERGTSAAGAGTAVPGHDPGTHWRAARPRPLDEPRPPPRRPQRLPGTYTGTTATPGQERALERLDPLVDPAASLPASAWQDRRVRAYVAAKYATCWVHRPELGPDQPAQAIPPSRVLTPPRDSRGRTPPRGPVRWGDNPPTDCSVVPTKEARAIARALEHAGLEKGVVGNGIDAGLGGLTYRLKAPEGRPGHIYVFFEPALPHGEWICTACG